MTDDPFRELEQKLTPRQLAIVELLRGQELPLPIKAISDELWEEWHAYYGTIYVDVKKLSRRGIIREIDNALTRGSWLHYEAIVPNPDDPLEQAYSAPAADRDG